MTPFRRRRKGSITATFEPAEADLLANLARQVVELLRDRHGESVADTDPLAAQLGMNGPVMPPEDPVLRRLLPDAYSGDEAEESGEFRRYTEQSLTAAKVSHAEAIIAALVVGGFDPDASDIRGQEQVDVELGPEASLAWLKSLTDIRLALAIRLGIEAEEDVDLVAHSEDPAVAAMSDVYDWLGLVQESLVAALP
ncbi:DUF2017 domain-containing protein [Aeromicrobium sp. Leaf350]|uniref:DUF2017 domain-containing protein n=1 Tax=Aeromicrobium sp. Leaf350 TaxID=2876565 RepID=UPI001E551225|nr:DUF2017 domain-containing protein [Aeromicrobium sp. Leaf350]